MSVILQEEDLQKINYELQRISELSKSVVKGDDEAIKAGFAISMKSRNIQKLFLDRGILQEEDCL
ncbi:MAG: hypothetical protein K9L24_03705 [Spirochaetia bacterium]|nr:hypothetical protein [Spirochaetia bacterium]